MRKKFKKVDLDKEEQEIENNFEKLKPISGRKKSNW